MATPPSTSAARKKHSEAIAEAVHALYTARMAGAVDEFVSYFAPDARLTVVGNPALSPGAGMRLGREDIARYLQHLHDQNAYLSHRIEDIVTEGDHVVVRWTAEVRFLDNGRSGTYEILDHIRVKDGLIVELTHFYDTGGIAIARGRVKIA
ncbi:MAG: nuclear transport factor 2 family protein [Phreatobacter sp.]|uniref:nuclear transport factor 2 family protein n=1 Tax=Phreatobacter sp. TaxID=1966341 RepID=UPI0027325D3D|nr:nuclear transport factor 2 family protein [Phreatobacter sp.]MDP2802012.1 nuclear transport factor 2 family protein [Phreatobacter sp.]